MTAGRRGRSAVRGRSLEPILLLAAALVAGACAGEPPDLSGDTAAVPRIGELGVTQLVGSVDSWSLLAIPGEGGTATARPLDDPSRSIWEGRTRLPPARDVHVLEGPVAVLLTSEGEVLRYDLVEDSLESVGRLSGRDLAWSQWGAYGTYLDPADSAVLAVGPEGAWRYELAERPIWAGPVAEGRVVLLVEGERRALWLVERGADEPVARLFGEFEPPVLVTAWGRRLIVAARAGGTAAAPTEATEAGGEESSGSVPEAPSEVRFVSVPGLVEVGRAGTGGPIAALTVSPSSHELYASLGGETRLVRIDRFSKEVSSLAGPDRGITDLRTSLFGGFLLGADVASVYRIPLADEPVERIGGWWRRDLPLGLPDGRVLLADERGVRLLRPGAGGATALADPPSVRWAAVRWNPAPPPVVARRAGEAAGESAAIGGGAVARGGGPGGGAGRGAEPGGDTLGTGRPDSALVRDRVREGFYAIVVSARDSTGAIDLARRLAESGYPTAVQRHRDDAGRLWYRGLVGPYAAREEAEASGRQLRREHSLRPWVTEIRSELTADDIFR